MIPHVRPRSRKETFEQRAFANDTEQAREGIAEAHERGW